MEHQSADELLDLINKKESKKRKRNLLIVVIIIIAGLVFTGIAVSKIFHVEKKSEKIEVTKDSLEKENQRFNINISREDSAKKIVLLFLKRKYFCDDSIAMLFTDTIKRYFRKENIGIIDLIKEERKFWKRFPDEVFRYDSNFAINILDSVNTSVLISGAYRRSPNDAAQNLIQEIKLNKGYKIYYARAFLTEK